MIGGGEMKSRDDAETKMRRIRNMKDSDKIIFLLEIMVDLLMDIRFGVKKE
jgi:hypothetical protein